MKVLFFNFAYVSIDVNFICMYVQIGPPQRPSFLISSSLLWNFNCGDHVWVFT